MEAVFRLRDFGAPIASLAVELIEAIPAADREARLRALVEVERGRDARREAHRAYMRVWRSGRDKR